MAAITVTVCLYFLLSLGDSVSLSQICSFCPGDVRPSSEVSRFCQSHGVLLYRRCCMNKTGNSDTIVGLDLGNCSLNHLDFALNLTESLNVIDISQNPLVDLSQEIFRGLSGLWYIAVPLNLSCPGGNDTWGNVTKTSSALICQDQNSACGTTGNLTLLCPESSMCAPDGPGYTKCVCAPGFTGYKCLREGPFPMLMFFGILGVVTIMLSLFLWSTQRRKVKSQ